jgi:uncharacterized protein YfiM (DUF2279 family)
MQKTIRLFILLVSFTYNSIGNVFANESESIHVIEIDSSNQELKKDTSKIIYRRFIPIVSGISSLYAGSMAYLQFIWYKDETRVPFQYYDDFKGYNQIDKFGHVYGSYLESYIGFHSLLWAGVPRKKAAIYGGSLGFVLQLPIEIWDGMYEGWGFSWSDVAANALGSVLVIGQELAFQEQVVKYKFSFSPSPYATKANGYLGKGFDELFYDYNGHTYWLSLGLNKIIPKKQIPDWINIAFGYSAGGMYGEFKNIKSYDGKSIPETERYRQYLLSLDIDFTKIPTKNKFLKTVFNSMLLVKIPFPALEINSKSEIRLHGFYC